MSELPHFPFYVGDFLADTSHLDAEETGAYILLILDYYKHQVGPEVDERFLQKIAKLSRSKWKKLSPVLLRFFEVRDGRLYQERIEKELENMRLKVDQARKAGIASGRARQRTFNGRSTGSERGGNQSESELDIKTLKPKNISLRPPDVPKQIWNDFKAQRTKKLTQTALAGIERESKKAGITVTTALTICCERGWQGFKAEWVDKKPANKQGSTNALDQIGEMIHEPV